MARTPASESHHDHGPHLEERIRQRAYHLWEAAGKPHGRDHEFWERARELEKVTEGAGSPLPSAKKAKSPAKTGASSGSSTDQGATKTTPAAKRLSPAKPKKPT
jgi:hypothetical protein